MNSLYKYRKSCCICGSNNLEQLYTESFKISLSLNLFKKKNRNPFIPYNIFICTDCNTAQNKYLGDLNKVYEISHNDNCGTIKDEKHNFFKNFIINNKNINSICEIGSSNGYLADSILINNNLDYTIVEPNYTNSNNGKIKVIKKYFEDVKSDEIDSNCLVMSDVFEHFYDPLKILEKIKKHNFEYIILNHPDFDSAVKNDNYIILNIEHTFLIEHQLLFNLFNNYGYYLNRREQFKNSSLFLEFKKNTDLKKLKIKNYSTHIDIRNYINKIENIVKNINIYLKKNLKKKIYIWPCSVHTTTLFLFGLNYNKLEGILDNSKNKINKYLDGYNLFCSSFSETINMDNDNTNIIITGANDYINELKLNCKNVEIKFLKDFI